MARALSIGDIHGCARSLEHLLAFVRPDPGDQLVFHGDLVDRGPDSARVVEMVRQLVQMGAICLRGNHEHMMRGARFSLPLWNLWVVNSGTATLNSYGAPDDQRSFARHIPDAHWDFLDRQCLDWFEMRDFLLVHAGALPHLPMDRQPGQALHWLRLHELEPHQSGKTIVCGHTPQPGGSIAVLPGMICIDSGCGTIPEGGCATCLDLHSGEFWQANEDGPVRTGEVRLARPARRRKAGHRHREQSGPRTSAR